MVHYTRNLHGPYGWGLILGAKPRRSVKLEHDLKNNPSAPGVILSRLKMLTYCVYAPILRPLTPCQAP